MLSVNFWIYLPLLSGTNCLKRGTRAVAMLCRLMRAHTSYVHHRRVKGCAKKVGLSQAYSTMHNFMHKGPLLTKKKLFLVPKFTLKRCFFLGAPEPRRTTNVVQVPGLSPETMHGVVKDVARYEDFLPFCSASTVTEVKQGML